MGVQTRRQFLRGGLGVVGLGLLSGCAGQPPWVQPPRLPRIGYLSAGSASSPYLEAFRSGMRDFGFVEGTNVVLEYRLADDDNRRLNGLARELVERRVELIVTHALGVTVAHQLPASTPIVM